MYHFGLDMPQTCVYTFTRYGVDCYQITSIYYYWYICAFCQHVTVVNDSATSKKGAKYIHSKFKPIRSVESVQINPLNNINDTIWQTYYIYMLYSNHSEPIAHFPFSHNSPNNWIDNKNLKMNFPPNTAYFTKPHTKFHFTQKLP